MTKYIISITVFLCAPFCTSTVATSCSKNKDENKSESVRLPECLTYKSLVRLHDEKYDGRFLLEPFYHKNVLESAHQLIHADGFDQELILVKMDEISPTEWKMDVVEYRGAQDTFQLSIKCEDESRSIYKYDYQNGENGFPFSGYFLVAPSNFEPEFYPDGEYGTKYDRIIDHRFNINGVSAPTPIFFVDFYHARETFFEGYGDLTSMELEDVDTFVAKERNRENYKGKWEIIGNHFCDISLPNFTEEFPHRYILTKINTTDASYNEYILYIFAKFSEKYSCVLVNKFTAGKTTEVDFKLNCEGSASTPILWAAKNTNAWYWDSYPTLDPCNSKGGFSITYTQADSDGDTYITQNDYAYVVNAPQHSHESPLNLISDLRWRLVKAHQNDEEIRVLSDYENLILGSNDQSYISENSFYGESLNQGLIEEEYED